MLITAVDPTGKFVKRVETHKIKYDWNQDRTIKVFEPTVQMTQKFTIYDANFGQTHAVGIAV